MLHPDVASAIAHARYRSLLADAELERQIRVPRRTRPGRPSLLRRLAASLGLLLAGGR